MLAQPFTCVTHIFHRAGPKPGAGLPDKELWGKYGYSNRAGTPPVRQNEDRKYRRFCILDNNISYAQPNVVLLYVLTRSAFASLKICLHLEEEM